MDPSKLHEDPLFQYLWSRTHDFLKAWRLWNMLKNAPVRYVIGQGKVEAA